MHLRFILVAVWSFFLYTDLWSQSVSGSTSKKKILQLTDCKIELDVLTLIPHSIVVISGKDTITSFKVYNNTLEINADECNKHKGKEIFIQYRCFKFNLEKPYFVIDSTMLTFKEKAVITAYEYAPNTNRNAMIDSKGLDYKGSFSRGLSIGNTQSLVLNSNFDMQMIGDLGNGLKVVAAISDENLPIQAQGNTQQLQEFDKVFIQVSKGKTSITAGDYDLRRPNSYFMNYFKKLKGITLATTFNLNKETEVFTKGSFAISRGKFSRQTLPTKEGNQGPYRLQGNNGERFIIVLAGTEKVFFNGILLTRGFDYDYVIDYNRAEITFSPNRVIARDSRVIVDYEYTDISYLRSLYAGQTEFKNKKWTASVNFYSEQDSKNATGDIQLDSTDLEILKQSGDDLSKSTRQSIRLISNEEKAEPTRIFYAGKDDPMQLGHIILLFTENPDSARYTAIFTEVGAGKGDYIIDNSKNKNARVYKYAGKNEGTYLPVVQLIPPEKKQMITANAGYKINNNTELFAEIGLSNLDKNRRSVINNDDNAGISSFISMSHLSKLDSAGNWNMAVKIKNEFIQKNFNPLNPYRLPEFIRDWNLDPTISKTDENLLLTNFSIQGKSGLSFDYGYNRFDKPTVYKGEKQEAVIKYMSNRFQMRAFSNWLTARASLSDQQSTFIRPNVSLLYKIDKTGNWGIGAEYDGESNTVKSIATDTLAKKSYAFHNIKWFISNDVNKSFSIKLVVSARDDYFSRSSIFHKASKAREIELAGKWEASENSNLTWSLIGRDLHILEADLLPNDKSKKTILGRLDYAFSVFNQGIKSTTSYNTNSGQEPRIEYVFQKVEVGQGDYIFIGESENPNLSNIQDFRYDPTNPLSGYIRLTLINNEFIRTNNIELNQNLVIEPSRFKKLDEGETMGSWVKFYSKFSTLSNFRITKKQMQNEIASLGSYLDFSLTDTSLVAYSALNTNTIFFNRGNVKYDIQFGNRNNQNRTVQVSGREDRGLNELFFRTRWNIMNKADLFLIFEKGNKTYRSESFGDRNLDLDTYRIRPEVSYRPNQQSRLNFKYQYQKKQQKLLSQDMANQHEFSSEFAFRKASKYSLDILVSVVNIQFSGRANSPIEYDMLEGLKNGKNFLWNFVYTKRIGKNIDLVLNYEGRKTGIAPLVNVGRAQIKATF